MFDRLINLSQSVDFLYEKTDRLIDTTGWHGF